MSGLTESIHLMVASFLNRTGLHLSNVHFHPLVFLFLILSVITVVLQCPNFLLIHIILDGWKKVFYL